MAYEETITGILFALMIEGGKYLTQEDIEYMTGFSRSPKILSFFPEKGNIPSNDSSHLIKLNFIRKMTNLSTELLGGNEELISVFLALMFEKDPVTQDEIINMTGSSRSNVSKVLTMMEELKVLDVIKKPKIRKKYYESKTTIEEYGLGKRKRVQGYYAQIRMMMEKKFLPDLEQIEHISEEDTAEKERLTRFFNENFNFFNIFIRYSNVMHTTVQKVLKEFVDNYLN